MKAKIEKNKICQALVTIYWCYCKSHIVQKLSLSSNALEFEKIICHGSNDIGLTQSNYKYKHPSHKGFHEFTTMHCGKKRLGLFQSSSLTHTHCN